MINIYHPATVVKFFKTSTHPQARPGASGLRGRGLSVRPRGRYSRRGWRPSRAHWPKCRNKFDSRFKGLGEQT